MSAEITHSHIYGEPINIVRFTDNNEFIVKTDELNKLFLHPDVKHRAVVVFSIVGAFRKGKSFLLDYCLRFLYANYPSINNPKNPTENAENWIGNEDEPLKGFSWRTGAARDTSGIVMWSDIFLHIVENTGEKLAIVVMDTQGLFDNETTPLDNSRIFALGTLISSIQVLNLSGVVQEDQLQYLQFATEFAKFAADDSHGTAGKPFQNLMFLLRDWAYIDDFDYGIEGGEEYLQDFLKINTTQKSIIKSVREHIRGSFEELSCSLLPHPGKIVAGGIKQEKKYDGRWIGMDSEFRDHLFTLIEHLLKPERLIPKKINGEYVKGAEFLAYILQYFQLFQTDRMPHAHSIYESTIEQQMNILVNNCFSEYKETIFKNQNIIQEVEMIPILHEMSKNQAVLKFKESRKMGNQDHESKFRKILEKQIDEIFNEWESQKKESIEKIKKEMESARIAVEEKMKLQQEQFESEKRALERLQELEKVKYENDLKDQRHEQEKKIAEERWKAEKEKLERIMAEKLRDDAIAQKLEAEREKGRWEDKFNKNPLERLCRIM